MSEKEIKYKFIQVENHKRIMKLMGYSYDDTKSYHRNCLEFLIQMDSEGRLNELEKAMGEQVI